MSVAKTILEQLGGNKFAAMTGAKNFVSDTNSLTFTIGKNAAKVNKVVVCYDRSNDEYNVGFYNVRGFEAKTIRNVDGVQADRLCAVVEDVTGLRTSL